MPHTPDDATRPDVPACLQLILGERPPPFALLHRPHVTGPDAVEILLGDVVTVPRLADLPLPGGAPPGGARADLLAVVPFRQVRERGFECVDDGTPLLALRVTRRDVVTVGELLALVPDGPDTFVETGYDVPDAEYEAQVSAVLAGEIAAGAGSNFVIHRALTGRLSEPPARAALGALRRLLIGERRAYWTFAVHTPEVTLVGATPERHVSLTDGLVRMNPISGTLRHPAGGYASRDEQLAAVEAFLADPKERDELVMVVDEELKMMAAVCDRGGRVEGPYLKEMAHLAHTEYVLTGRTSMDVRQVLTATMFAPTVTGSPIRNACRVIARHERRGRSYYGGVLALVGRDDEGRQTLDAPILIRTAEIAADGTVRVRAGATLVRGSRPDAELAETRAKAAGVLAALEAPAAGEPAAPDPSGSAGPIGSVGSVGSVGADARVSAMLTARNATLAPFWLREQPRAAVAAGGAEVVVVDAEDDFTAMLAHVLRSLGRSVCLVPSSDAAAVARLAGPAAGSPQLVVLGPGPGDPRDGSDPRLAALRAVARARLAAGTPMLAVCLGHQVLGAELGLPLRRLPRPNQGVQERIDLFGTPRDVGFYNSFAAHVPPAPRPDLVVSAEAATGRVHAFRGPAFTGLQFHAESVLTTDGVDILRDELLRLAPS